MEFVSISCGPELTALTERVLFAVGVGSRGVDVGVVAGTRFVGMMGIS